MTNPINVDLDRRAAYLPSEDHHRGDSAQGWAVSGPLATGAPRTPFGIYYVSAPPQGEQR